MKKILLLIVLVHYFFVVHAQSDNTIGTSPYRLSWAVDLPIATAALGMGVSYLVLDKQTAPLTTAYINSLDRTNVWAFDRAATYNWSRPIAIGSDVLLYTSCALPLALLGDSKIRKDYLKIGVLYLETFALTAAVTSLTKNLVKRPRPFVYNEAVDLQFKEERDAQYAFFSGHTSMTAAMCFMTAKVFQDYNKGSKAIPWIWAAAATVPAVTGILRQQAGKHFWTDVISGYLIGAAIGVLVPELHRVGLFQKKKAKRPEFSF
ncbi:phosphatase PAP2 family protein [Aureispira anguillae]|uniref:Phosphatase PAP2 family protein n=1 Tax=Aureispira anguillae TaxID=2864201 RepID=A0A915YGJ9_9BACT|nr:phosphatase PAP2 family protein [Aureispira anguillae]BDS12645.1 phosphatase PAP2 family protein [Aureispira anguillae]